VTATAGEYERIRIIRDESVGFVTETDSDATHTYFSVTNRKQVTIKSGRKSFSVPLDYIHPRDELGYAYEISWHLKGGASVSSGRRRGEADILYCDEIP